METHIPQNAPILHLLITEFVMLMVRHCFCVTVGRALNCAGHFCSCAARPWWCPATVWLGGQTVPFIMPAVFCSLLLHDCAEQQHVLTGYSQDTHALHHSSLRCAGQVHITSYMLAQYCAQNAPPSHLPQPALHPSWRRHGPESPCQPHLCLFPPHRLLLVCSVKRQAVGCTKPTSTHRHRCC